MESLITQGLRQQAASIGKSLADYSIFKIECPSCNGFSIQCVRCSGSGWIEVKRKHVERKDEGK